MFIYVWIRGRKDTDPQEGKYTHFNKETYQTEEINHLIGTNCGVMRTILNRNFFSAIMKYRHNLTQFLPSNCFTYYVCMHPILSSYNTFIIDHMV